MRRESLSNRRRFTRARRVRIAAATIATIAATAVALPTLSWAHAVVYPRQSNTGSFEKYVLRVPNEKAVATTRVELHFPAGLRVTSFAEVPGWQLEVVTDSAKAITAAIWTGTLPQQRFIEFPFVAANPKTDTKLEWPAYQTYADGERVEWTGPEGSKRPASVTTIGAAATSAAGGGGGASRFVPWAALALAIVSLGLAMRKPEARPAA
jgi:uncharacterized protein YcnI